MIASAYTVAGSGWSIRSTAPAPSRAACPSSRSASRCCTMTPRFSAVYNPATGECFEAERGCGAWCGDMRLRVSAHDVLQGARLLSSRTEMRRRNWPALMPEAVFTDLSSLAYKLALVAAGRFDGLISKRASHDWDLAAAQLLIAEAGGRLSGADGAALVLNRPEPRHPGLVAAGTEDLHRALLQRLATA